jgi:hypothetical protein
MSVKILTLEASASAVLRERRLGREATLAVR